MAAPPEEEDPQPSFQIREMAALIMSVEQRCSRLEERNALLTKRLLLNQKAFIERNFSSKSTGLVRTAFEGWNRAMSELKMEHALDEANRSLQEFHEIAQDLGNVLQTEREARESADASHQFLKSELERLNSETGPLQERARETTARVQALEAQVKSAEQALSRTKMDCRGVLEAVAAYERFRHQSEHEDPDAQLDDGPISEGQRKCKETDDLMNRLTKMLKKEGEEVSSPARRPPASVDGGPPRVVQSPGGVQSPVRHSMMPVAQPQPQPMHMMQPGHPMQKHGQPYRR